MTMLDRMRRHKSWLKWSLFVVVISFVFLYIPSFMGPTDGMPAGANDVVATVEGREITVDRFRRAYNQQMQMYRNQFGGNMDERLMKQLGIDQRIVQQMVEEEASLAEAGRLGIKASDQEVVARIRSLPAFQENGQFIGETRYRQVLEMQNPPLRADEFEEQVRRGITMEKLQGALTDWITVTEKDVDEEFRRRNEKVKLAVVNFPADKFREETTATDAEVSAWFDAHKNDYKFPDKRKVKFAVIDNQSIRERTQVSAADVQRQYQENQAQYATPEQVRASHILFKIEGKDEAEVRKQAEAVLKRAKSGEDFAKLANEFTDEEIGKTRGGDLDFFGRGQMAKEFEDAAFGLKPGEISDLVKTQFGLHIIRQTDRRAAATKSLDEVRPQIEDQIKWERATAEGQRLADELDKLIDDPSDFDTVAKTRGLNVAESGFFAKAGTDHRHRHGAGGGRARVRDEAGGSQRPDPHAAGLRLHHRHRHRGRPGCDARGSQGAGAGRRHQEQGGRDGAAARRGGGRAAEVRQLRGGGQGGGAGSEDHRADRARRADGRRRDRSGDRRGGVHAAGRRGQRSDPDRERRRGRQGAGAQGHHAAGAEGRTRAAAVGADQRAQEPLLLDLHDQGAREDAHQHQQLDGGADRRLTNRRS